MTDRLPVRKTYKLYVNGEFPRSESGRTFEVDGVHAALASRKDLRDAVTAARGAHPGWSSKTGYNRGQILYRVGEVLEARRSQFETRVDAAEVDAAIDRWVWYAGWADKLQQLAGTVNPVAGPFFNFTVPEPVGVVGMVAPAPALLGLVSVMAPALVSGNTVVLIAPEASALTAIDLAEVLATSDVPAGAVNVLTGRPAELLPWLASHMDVDAVDVAGASAEEAVAAEEAAADNMKRVVRGSLDESPYAVTALMEMKTVWHPTKV